MSDAAKLQIGKVQIPEALLRARPQTAAPAGKVTPAPTDNPLYKVIFSTSLEPEEKRKQIAAFLTFTGTKAEMREHMRLLEQFEDYFETERKRVQEELLRLTDTDTFGVLKGVIDDMNNDLIDFEEQMRPLTDMLDAIYKLETDGKAIDVVREIRSDRKDEAAREEQRKADEGTYRDLSDRIKAVTENIAHLGEEKSWFGFGGVKEASRKQIVSRNLELDALQGQLKDLQARLETAAAPASSNLPEYAAEKEQLRKVLDISRPEHAAQVKGMVDCALKFVQTSSDRVGEVRQHFAQMSEQMERIRDTNGKMSGVRAMMSEAMSDAKAGTLAQHETLAAVPEGETLVNRIEREGKLEAVDDHVTQLDSSIRSNTVALAELTSEAITIRTARSEHQQMLDRTRMLHTQGIAGVASRLNTTINAVNLAALGESSKLAGQTIRQMVEDTTETTQKEVIRSALGVQDATHDVEQVLSDLSQLGETLRASSDIYRSGLTELHDMLDKARQITTDVQQDIKQATAIHAEEGVRPNGADTAPVAAQTMASPFGTAP